MWMVEPLKIVCEDIFQKRYPTMIYSDLLLYFEHMHHVHDMKLIDQISEGLNQNIRGKSIPEEVYELGSDVFREYLKIINGSVTEKCRFEMVETYVTIHGFELNQSDLNKIECQELVSQSKKNPEELLINSDEKTDETVNLNPIGVKNSNFSDADSVTLDLRSKKINSEYIKTVLDLIDYTKMTVNEFFEGPGKSKILSFEKKFDYLYKIAAKTAAENDRLQNIVEQQPDQEQLRRLIQHLQVATNGQLSEESW
nr:uncharacterized protein LOC108059935 [Drosophila takahashii]